MEADEGAYITVLIETEDRSLVDDMRGDFADDEISVSSNMIGGFEIAIFVTLGVKTAADVVRAILAFLQQKAGRYLHSKIVVGQESIELHGYGPEDAERLIQSKVVAAMRRVRDSR